MADAVAEDTVMSYGYCVCIGVPRKPLLRLSEVIDDVTDFRNQH